MKNKAMCLVVEKDKSVAKLVFDTIAVKSQFIPIYSCGLKSAKRYLRSYPEIKQVILTYGLSNHDEQKVEENLCLYIRELAREIEVISVLTIDRNAVRITKNKVLLLPWRSDVTGE